MGGLTLGEQCARLARRDRTRAAGRSGWLTSPFPLPPPPSPRASRVRARLPRYDRNKTFHPASRWEVWDPNKDYGAYKIFDTSQQAN